jgi:glycosyltransferase involved in cell wall biosynthesis
LNTGNKPVFVVYNGCEVAEFPDYNNPGYNPVRPFLFSIGTILPKKNFHVLACLLKDKNYELIIAGKGRGDYARKIIEAGKKFDAESRIKLIGPVSIEDKYWYLKNCTAFLFPSLAEGFGIPPIEAMHFGKPVFLSTFTSLPEIGGQYAYYFNNFDPDDMLDTFEKGMADYMNANSASAIIQHANKFNWEKNAKEYWKIYKNLQ